MAGQKLLTATVYVNCKYMNSISAAYKLGSTESTLIELAFKNIYINCIWSKNSNYFFQMHIIFRRAKMDQTFLFIYLLILQRFKTNPSAEYFMEMD